MNVLVDTCVWSLALRRGGSPEHPAVVELADLIREGRAVMLGLVRQELLSGVRTLRQFERLRTHLRAFPDVALETTDHEAAAAFFNRCRAKGIQGSTVDFILCAIASRRQWPIFTIDADFGQYAPILAIHLHASRVGQ